MRGLGGHIATARTILMHSHPKVAAAQIHTGIFGFGISTHSHPKVAAKTD